MQSAPRIRKQAHTHHHRLMQSALGLRIRIQVRKYRMVRWRKQNCKSNPSIGRVSQGRRSPVTLFHVETFDSSSGRSKELTVMPSVSAAIQVLFNSFQASLKFHRYFKPARCFTPELHKHSTRHLHHLELFACTSEQSVELIHKARLPGLRTMIFTQTGYPPT